MIVANAVAVLGNVTERLDGRTADRRDEAIALDPKAADTVVAALIVTTQSPTPLHAPPQPLNPKPLFGLSVRITTVPGAKLALQLAPQLMPVGQLNTVP